MEKKMNRKLIRPNFSEYKEKISKESSKKKIVPPYETSAENYYFLKQMNKRMHVAVVFQDGEALDGYIEWYDRDCFKLNRDEAPNLLIYKNSIKYIYKLESQSKTKEDSESSQ